MPLEPGLSAAVTLDVGDDDTALAFRSGQVAVLATPRLIALCEEASLLAVDGRVPEGHTTVGMRVQLDHLAPTAVGTKVQAEATLEKVEGRRLTFTVSATDERGLVAAGKVTRVVVDVDRFLEKCTSQATASLSRLVAEHQKGGNEHRAEDPLAEPTVSTLDDH